MEFKQIMTLFFVLTFFVDFLGGTPTFGDEFVHIKVHVPKDISNSHGALQATHVGSPHYPHTSHKVIHHYHRRRKPYKKSTAPPLENVILAELDKPHKEEPHFVEETFVVKEEKLPAKKINTFTVIEETIKKPLHSGYGLSPHAEEVAYHNDHVETFRVIESKEQGKHNYVHTAEPHVKTVELQEEKQIYEGGYGDHDYRYQQSPKETFKLIETAQHKPSKAYEHHTDVDLKAYRDKYHQHVVNHENDDKYHYKYGKTHEFLETEKSHHSDGYPKHYEHSEDYHQYKEPNPKQFHEEIIEIVKTKNLPKFHPPLKYESMAHEEHEPKSHHKEIIEIVEESSYAKPDDEYVYHQQATKPTYRHYSSKKPETVIEEQLEYLNPSVVYKENIQKPFITDDEYEKYKTVGPIRTEQTVYGNKEAADNDYYYSEAGRETSHEQPAKIVYHYPKALTVAAKPMKSHHHHMSAQTETHYYGDTENDESGYHYKTPPTATYSDDREIIHQQKSPSEENSSQFKASLSYHDTAASSSFYSQPKPQDDKVMPTAVAQPLSSSNIDWPEGVGKSYATETYTGYDSYSAGHVQGVGSGGYRYPSQYH